MRIVIKSWLDILYRLLNSCRYECNFYVNHLIFSGLGLHILCKSLFNELQQNQDQNDTYTRRKIRSGLIFTASINSKTRGDHLYSTIKGPSSFFSKIYSRRWKGCTSIIIISSQFLSKTCSTLIYHVLEELDCILSLTFYLQVVTHLVFWIHTQEKKRGKREKRRNRYGNNLGQYESNTEMIPLSSRVDNTRANITTASHNSLSWWGRVISNLLEVNIPIPDVRLSEGGLA